MDLLIDKETFLASFNMALTSQLVKPFKQDRFPVAFELFLFTEILFLVSCFSTTWNLSVSVFVIDVPRHARCVHYVDGFQSRALAVEPTAVHF